MPRDLFGSVTDPPIHVGTRSQYSVPISLAVHLAVLVPLVVIPILATDILPDPPTTLVIVGPPPTPPEPPPPAPRPHDPPPVRVANPNAAPIVAPDEIRPETPAQLVPFEAASLDPGTLPGGGGADVVDLTPPPPAAAQRPVEVGGKIRAPERVHYVAPEYLPVARAARIEGMVIIQATIDIDGRVIDTRVLRSIPMLDQPAVDAVRQWRYKPTTLNGVPVPVLMTVTVMFRLN